jgi:tetratricopeptide (TPR) repeat protein
VIGRSVRWTLALVVALATATGGHAQVPTLDRVDSLVAAGDYAVARSTLERWFSARDEFDVPGSDRARALMLRGQLAPDPETAEPHYLSVVLGYPTSEHAPEALLRLGQGLLAAGEASRAAAYLQRLVSDYPGRSQRTPALLWLARANSAAGRHGAACSAAREGLRDGRDPDLGSMLQIEAGAACGIAADGDASSPGSTPARSAGTGQDPVGSFAAQTGAFRQEESARGLMERLQAADFEPRLTLVPGSDLMRVRIGRFTDRGAAARLVDRLKSRGFDALVVTDADREREP